MRLIIDIDEHTYTFAKCYGFLSAEDEDTLDDVAKAIANGTPIPDNATVCDIEQIRAEIWDDIGGSGSDYTDGYNDGLYYAIDVIDKYKGDKE